MCVSIYLCLLSPQYLKAVITPECLLVLDYRNLNLEQWLFRELPAQLAGEGQLVTYPLPFEFRAMEALLQYRVSLCARRRASVRVNALPSWRAAWRHRKTMLLL